MGFLHQLLLLHIFERMGSWGLYEATKTWTIVSNLEKLEKRQYTFPPGVIRHSFSTAVCGCFVKSSWTLAVPSASASERWWPGCRPSFGPWPGTERWCRSSPRRCTATRPSATARSSSGPSPSRRSACRWSCSWSLAQFLCRHWCRRSP